MPRLDSEAARAVSEYGDPESFDMSPVPEGEYRLRLVDVEFRRLEVSKEPKLIGAQMLVWDFAIVDGKYAGRRFAVNRVVPPAEYRHGPLMLGRLNQMFTALGGTPADDTDDLIGRTCLGFIEVVPDWRRDARPGEMVNRLEELRPDEPTAPKGDDF